MKEFNTTGACIPSKHYMVDRSEAVHDIRILVDAGKYFTINRARQFGKTTTITALRNELAKDYEVISLDFQGLGTASFQTEEAFCSGFIKLVLDRCEYGLIHISAHLLEQLNHFIENEIGNNKLEDMMRLLRRWCADAERPIVLIIDEVDSAANSQVFLDFLAQLRDGFISREVDGIPAFHSVILAGVNDIKHLKSKIRDDGQHKVNSPWNIAADFNVDMSLSAEGIRHMLDEYNADHHLHMDTESVACKIHDYTSGYPYLVSRICQLIDISISTSFGLDKAWTGAGITEAVKMILSESNTLFQSLTGKLTNYPELKASIRSILMEGTKITYNPDQEDIVQMEMYGLIRNDHNTVRIANRIFESRLYNLFLSEEELKNNVFSREGEFAKNIFISDGKLNMRLILERFITTYHQIYGPLQEKFKEKDGRELFLLYLKPIINGTGNYYIEAQTREQTRTDVIVDYLGQQYVIELKIWRGERYNAEGEKQISAYLDHFNLTTVYMLSFNFNRNKQPGVERIEIGEKVLFEGTV